MGVGLNSSGDRALAGWEREDQPELAVWRFLDGGDAFMVFLILRLW